MELDTIERMRFQSILTQIQSTRSLINDVSASRIAFNIAEELYGRGDFIGALAQYQLVILEDPNFNDAQDGVNRSISAYRTQVLAEIESADYESIIRVLSDALQTLENDAEFLQRLMLTEQSIMFCSNCGKQLNAGDVFCAHCGANATGGISAQTTKTVTAAKKHK